MKSPSVLFKFILIVLVSRQTCGYLLDVDQVNVPASLPNWLTENRKFDFFNNHLSPSASIGDLQNIEFENISAINTELISNNVPNSEYYHSTCQLVKIVHLLYQAGCQPKAIASYACSGSCPSYVQMSASKFWQHERSCSCCQQTGVQEATFTLDCPSLNPPYRKVKTYSPIDCMCRSCTDLGKEKLQPQELVEALVSEKDGNENQEKL